MTAPIRKQQKIVRKRTKTFIRFQSENFMRVPSSWRKPRGIDNRVRRRFRGTKIMPNKGFGNDKKTRFMNKNSGLFTFRVENVNDLEMLLMHNKKYAAVISRTVSTVTWRKIIARAQQLGVRVMNGRSKMHVEESE
eukprot:Lankesteria_metandrocarpae@DN3938_c0_g1_i2.p1